MGLPLRSIYYCLPKQTIPNTIKMISRFIKWHAVRLNKILTPKKETPLKKQHAHRGSTKGHAFWNWQKVKTTNKNDMLYGLAQLMIFSSWIEVKFLIWFGLKDCLVEFDSSGDLLDIVSNSFFELIWILLVLKENLLLVKQIMILFVYEGNVFLIE